METGRKKYVDGKQTRWKEKYKDRWTDKNERDRNMRIARETDREIVIHWIGQKRENYCRSHLASFS